MFLVIGDFTASRVSPKIFTEMGKSDLYKYRTLYYNDIQKLYINFRNIFYLI